jgi:2-keto-myo-inositol isomerase
LAEVKAFNDSSTEKAHEALSLMKVARTCRAESVALIPRVADGTVERYHQRDALRRALKILHPMLEEHGLVGLIEPLGFVASSLRYKADVVAVLDEMNRPACFKIVHDTFHHHLAGGGAIYADLTGLVHISGITDSVPSVAQMADEHRVLVGPGDRLNSIDQLRALRKSGYQGVVSFEAFAPEIHSVADPAAALARSIDFISSQLAEVPA